MSLEKKIDFEEPTKGKNEIVENFWKLSKFCYANFEILLVGAYRVGDNVRIYGDDDCIIDTKHMRITNEGGIEYIKKINFDIERDCNGRLELLTDEDLSGMIDDIETLIFAAEQRINSIFNIIIK